MYHATPSVPRVLSASVVPIAAPLYQITPPAGNVHFFAGFAVSLATRPHNAVHRRLFSRHMLTFPSRLVCLLSPACAPLLAPEPTIRRPHQSDIGAAYGTAKSGVGISSMGVMNPGLVMRNIIPVVMAGVLGIYGLIVAVILSGSSECGHRESGTGLRVGDSGNYA